MSALSCYVVRPGGGFAGLVPVALSLWNRGSSAMAEVAWSPAMADRVVFLDRPEPWTGAFAPDGRASQGGRDWRVSTPKVYETWSERGTRYTRHRATLVDEERNEAVGHYYWVLANTSAPDEEVGDDDTDPG